jgi:large subunit ribosomal protein L18e
MEKTNIQLKKLVALLHKQKKDIWKRIAKDLLKPTRQQRSVNLSKINRFFKEGETIIVPGKVLSDGFLEKKAHVAAFKFSHAAIEKVKKAGGATMTIEELLKKNPEAKGVRIIG